MTKKEYKSILYQIEVYKAELKMMDQAIIENSKQFSFQEYRAKLREFTELKNLRDTYKIRNFKRKK